MHTLGWWGMMARLPDSAFCLAKVVAKTQLSPLCTWSLLCSLPCSLGSVSWNMLIPQAGPFVASNYQETVTLFSFPPHPAGSFRLLSAAPLSLLPGVGHRIWAPSNELMCRSLRCACVQVGCYLYVFSSFSFRGDPSCHHASHNLFYFCPDLCYFLLSANFGLSLFLLFS